MPISVSLWKPQLQGEPEKKEGRMLPGYHATPKTDSLVDLALQRASSGSKEEGLGNLVFWPQSWTYSSSPALFPFATWHSFFSPCGSPVLSRSYHDETDFLHLLWWIYWQKLQKEFRFLPTQISWFSMPDQRSILSSLHRRWDAGRRMERDGTLTFLQFLTLQW